MVAALALFLTAVIAIILLPTPVWGQTAPFDLQDAVNEANPGDTVVVPAGVYPGPLTIDRSVTLQGEGWPVIQGPGEGDVITISAPNVTINGFIIQGSGDSLDRENAAITALAPGMTIENNRFEDSLFGIYLKEAPDSIIRNNIVHGKDLPTPRRGDGIRIWYSGNTLIEDNLVENVRDVVIWFSPDSVIRNNTVEGGRYGIHTMFSDNQLVEHNVLRNNSVGAFLMYGRGLTMLDNVMYNNHGPSGYGIGLKDVDNIIARGNRLVSNRIGAYVDNSPREQGSTVLFENNLLAYNEMGVVMLPLVKRNTFTNNIFQENNEQIAIAGGGELSDNHWNLDGHGNYWSDYAGFDADGDSIGDLPYQSQSLYEDLMEEHPELRLFQLSPATDALDLAAEAFPIFQPRSKMADEYPLTAPPQLPPMPGLPTAPLGLNLLAALGMLAIALVIVAIGWRFRFS